MRRSIIALAQVIRAVHQAAEIHAVLQAKHVARLMRRYLTAAQQNQLAGVAPRFAVESRIMRKKLYTPTRSRSEACPKTKFQPSAGYKSAIVIARMH